MLILGIDPGAHTGVAHIVGEKLGEFALHFEGAFQRWTESTESLSAPARAESSSRYAKGEF